MRKDRSLKLLVVMLKASQTVNDIIKKDMQGYGLNPTEYAVLELLYNKGDHPIQHIGKKILLASSSLTYVVDKLEERKNWRWTGRNYNLCSTCWSIKLLGKEI